jgi:hypothetical protein
MRLPRLLRRSYTGRCLACGSQFRHTDQDLVWAWMNRHGCFAGHTPTCGVGDPGSWCQDCKYAAGRIRRPYELVCR